MLSPSIDELHVRPPGKKLREAVRALTRRRRFHVKREGPVLVVYARGRPKKGARK